MLTPVDIHNKEFSRSFRGFNQEEVDDFLDQVVNDYEKLYRDNSQMKKEIELCNKQLDQYKQLEKNLQDTLLVAQRTADEVVNTANIRGDEVRQAARQAGENLKREAELYAAKLKQDTERECRHKIETAAQQVRAAVTEYERIVRERRQFIAKMRNLMQTELGLLEEAYDIMPDRVQPDNGRSSSSGNSSNYGNSGNYDNSSNSADHSTEGNAAAAEEAPVSGTGDGKLVHDSAEDTVVMDTISAADSAASADKD